MKRTPTQISMQKTIEAQYGLEGRRTVDWILYDSMLTTASITQTLRFFQNTIGGVTQARTNMKTQGMLNAPLNFLITGISCNIFNNNGTAFFHAGGAAPSVSPLNFIFSQMFWELKIEPQTLYEGVGSQFFNFLNYMNDTAATLGVAVYPNAGLWKTVRLNQPILLPASRNFSVNMTVTTPAAAQGYVAANTLIYFYLHGLMYGNA